MTITIDLDALRDWESGASAEENPNRDPALDPDEAPILDKTCWHCGGPFETRNPHEVLCPHCARLADEDTRALPWWDTVPLPELDEDAFTMALRYSISRR